MAKVASFTVPPEPVDPERFYTLELTEYEAKVLRTVLGDMSSYGGNGTATHTAWEATYSVYAALMSGGLRDREPGIQLTNGRIVAGG